MAADIKIGDEFLTKGYDLVASAKYAEGGGGPFGEVILLSNNSSHFLLAVRQGDADDLAQLERTYPYAALDEDGTAALYRVALRDLCALASSR